jgi:hypothetical protein
VVLELVLVLMVALLMVAGVGRGGRFRREGQRRRDRNGDRGVRSTKIVAVAVVVAAAVQHTRLHSLEIGVGVVSPAVDIPLIPAAGRVRATMMPR